MSRTSQAFAETEEMHVTVMVICNVNEEGGTFDLKIQVAERQ